MTISFDDALRECQHRGIRPIAGGTGVEEAAVIVAVVAAVAAAGVGTYTAVSASQAAAEQGKALKRQREMEAAAALDSAAFEEKQHRRRIALLRGEQEAAFAAAGVDTTSGTPLVQDIDLAQQGELEALAIKRAGRMSANASQFEANIAGWRAGQASRQIPLQIAGGVAQAVGSAASAYSYSSYQTASVRRQRSVTSDWI